MNLLDFIFPKKCILCKKIGSYLCENCFSYLSFDAKSLCLVCDRPSFNNLTHPKCMSKYSINGCFSALSYNKTAQKLIYNFKYKPYLSSLKILLTDLFYESIIQNENFQRQIQVGKWMFVPIPLSSLKYKKRGYNQSEILAKELSKRFGFSTQNLLKRTKDTKNQFKLKKEEREENIKGAFEILNHKSSTRLLTPGTGGQVINHNFFLIDDIVTTGSTLKEAAKVLKKNGVNKVFGLTLARD